MLRLVNNYLKLTEQRPPLVSISSQRIETRGIKVCQGRLPFENLTERNKLQLFNRKHEIKIQVGKLTTPLYTQTKNKS